MAVVALTVLISDKIAPEGVQMLKTNGDITVTDGSSWSREELLTRIGPFDGLIVRSATFVDRQLLDAAPRLRVIGRAGVGVDNVDLTEATKRGILVINSPEGNTLSTAEHTIAMMMALARNIPQAHVALMRENRWDRAKYIGVQVAGKTVGILGLGRIGGEVAKAAIGLGMKVIAFDPLVNEERARRLGVELASVEDVCKEADFITVHTPLTKQTESLLGRREFDLMKPGVRIINCARGGIVDEEALYDAIVEGKVAGAALDVFRDEPPFHNKLLELEQVIVTPHLAASTQEAQVNVAVDVVKSVIRALHDEPVKNAVNAPALRGEGVDGLQPHLDCAQKLGHFFTAVFGGNFSRIEVIYRGATTRFHEDALTSALLKGMLAPVLHESVNLINAPLLAKERDMRLAVTKESGGDGTPGSITVRGKAGDRMRTVSGIADVDRGSVLTEIDGYPVNVETEGRLLVAYNVDRPGIIGRVGTLLGEVGVNIAFMQVGRKEIGSFAVMLLGIDEALDPEVLDRLTACDDLKDVRLVEW